MPKQHRQVRQSDAQGDGDESNSVADADRQQVAKHHVQGIRVGRPDNGQDQHGVAVATA